MIYLMKTNFLKRLESSINSFTLTLEKVLYNVESKIDKLKIINDDISLDIDENRDKKLQELKNVISRKIANPINENNKKIIIFTVFIDIAKYPYTNISSIAENKHNLNTAFFKIKR